MTDVIERLTKECPREDCRIMFAGGMATMLGHSPVYDRSGQKISKDPNTYTSDVRCVTCRKLWAVTDREGEEPKIVALQQPKETK